MIPFGLADWAIRHGVTPLALQELCVIVGMHTDSPINTAQPPRSEAYVQSRVRLDAPARGEKLWRNNVGVLPNPDTGQPVRYGLANDTSALNKRIKSGDLIGWRRVVITPAHVGRTIAQFVSRECKHEGWYYTGTEREVAQAQWAAVVVADGGDACFTTGAGSPYA